MSMVQKKSIADIEVKSKRVIVRVDFNVPLDENGNITDDKRIVAAVPTIKFLIDSGAKVILVSHLGRPKNGFEDKFSMKPTAKRLAQILKQEVMMAMDVIGDDAVTKSRELQDGQVLMLENVRFHKEEEKNDPVFAKALSELGDIFVNDAFGAAHRAHASTSGLADYLPAVSGFLIQRELDIMGRALSKPNRPFVAILGGAKVSDKIKVIENLLDKVDSLIIGGGMAYTFLKAKGYKIGNSICEDDKIELAKELMKKADEKRVNLLLPVGSIVSKEFKNDTESKYVPSDAMPDGWSGMDIGSLTIENFSNEIRKAKTVIWNGPMGVFEFPNFANGTREIARAVAESGALSIVGGGDSAAAIEQLGYADKITHISTGGGASLEYLEGKILPGVACLLNKNPRKKVIAANWKMNKTPKEAVKFISDVKVKLSDADCDVIVAVPQVAIADVTRELEDFNIKVAAQNCHFEDSGAFTGEISAPMLKEIGVDYVIVGHSERRQYFGETDEIVNKKVHAVLKAGMYPILCVGESLITRELNATAELVRYQVKVALHGVSHEQIKQTIIAYEPIWAIGTGKTATCEQANEVCEIIRELLVEMYGMETAENVRIQYGGSVTSSNAQDLFEMSDIDGGLVGGASLRLDEFEKIVKHKSKE